jgi:phosphomannomutase
MRARTLLLAVIAVLLGAGCEVTGSVYYRPTPETVVQATVKHTIAKEKL